MLKQIVAVCVFASLLPQFLNWYYSITINKPSGEYDFIIVGAGTTGNVIANRLTESPNVSVLVLEAGDNAFPNPLISVPMFVPLLQQSATDWMYRTEPQTHACKLLRNKISYWAKGKVIGGSSCLNYMLYVRGSKYDYDTWENEGALGWNYNNILPYFKKSEMAMNDDMSSDYHGKHGILKTGYSYMTPIAKLVLEAGKELGYKQRDYNAEDMVGIHQAQNTVYNGWRQSSNSFLKQAADQRPERLHIVGRAHVRQIVFEADANGVRRATGVVFVRDGVEVNVRARKEVILSAGSVGSPQLLLLSGIGPKKHLKEKEIPIIAELPGVGKNLQDHVMTPALFYGPNVPPRSSIDDYTIFTAMPQYLMGNGGPLTYSGLDVTSFIRTPLAKSKSPDIQITQLSAQLTLGSLDLNERLFNFGPEFLESLRKKATGRGGDPIYNFILAVTLLKPSSVGEIKLKTNNYKDHPLIQPNYLSRQIDVDKLIEGLHVVEQLEGTKVFQKMKLKMDFTSMGCGNETDPPRSAKFYECLIRSLTWTVFHPVGTAKMGSPDDNMAVVSPRLKVYKVDGLRVADASVMPTIPSANTQAACYMIGEKAADMIKQDWKLQNE